MIEAMYRDGARVFVEVGPGSILTSLVGTILAIGRIWPSRVIRRAHPACPAGFAPSLGWSVAGVPLRLEPLTDGPLAARSRFPTPAGR